MMIDNVDDHYHHNYGGGSDGGDGGDGGDSHGHWWHGTADQDEGIANKLNKPYLNLFGNKCDH